ncbi:MAG: TetR family transcriptional regulator [Porticoccaceae bacterium]|nr:TetR family transcriptional regulator [Porticoccaceae bacterium]MBT5578336.1 TetR family transcriptional regulator [Porticoccaceae bacterium]
MSDSTSTSEKVDGRRLRSDRSRQVIVEAMLQLINQGNLVPTAQQIADHAKVGIRSVFRHFEDMEAIFATGDQIWREGFIGKASSVDTALPLRERIVWGVNEIQKLYENNSNIMKSTATRRWRSAFLKQNYAKYQNKMRSDIARALPEISRLSQSRQEAIFAIMSFEYWDRLRDHQSLSPEDSAALLIDLLESLIPRA